MKVHSVNQLRYSVYDAVWKGITDKIFALFAIVLLFICGSKQNYLDKEDVEVCDRSNTAVTHKKWKGLG